MRRCADKFPVKSHFLYITIAAWVIASGALVAWLGGSHVIALFATQVPIFSQSKWSLTHVLAPDCQCSKIVLESLLNRKPAADIPESIVWMSEVEPLFKEKLVSRGFSFKLMTPNHDSSHIEGVPTLIIGNNKSEPVYVGGYSSSKLNSVSQVKDQEILKGLMGKGPVREFPIFGCATSMKYRRFLNPFASKEDSL